MADYNKRLVEVNEILNYLSEDDLHKIPEEVRDTIKENMDKQYTWKYDESKSLKQQNLNRDTIIILSYLNMEYLLNKEQKELMQNIHEFNEKNSQNNKQHSKYSNDNLFNQPKTEAKSQVTESEEDKKENAELICVKEGILKKIIRKIKIWLKIEL